MKKRIFAILILLTAALIACENEETPNVIEEASFSETPSKIAVDQVNDKTTDENIAKDIENSMEEGMFGSEMDSEEIRMRNECYHASGYYAQVIDYWENTREVRDISNVTEYLYDTDKQYYSKEDFENEPELIIHLAKNEIYARHGYVFKNEDLKNYFLGCWWYQPMDNNDNFTDAVFNEYEKSNIKVLAELDNYNKK